MVNRICFVFFVTGIIIGANAKSMSEKKLGKYSGIVAANLLSQNVEDSHGILLLTLAELLSPTDENILLTRALLKRGKLPMPVKTKATKEKLLQEFVKRGNYWFKKDLKKDTDARFKAILYYRITDKLTPEKPINEVIINLTKLDRMGFNTKLESLLEGGLNSVKTDDDFAVTGDLAAEPILSSHQSSYYPVILRKRSKEKGPRGSVEYKTGNTTFRLEKFTLFPGRESYPPHGNLRIKWALNESKEYISYSINKSLTILDNNKRALTKWSSVSPHRSFFNQRAINKGSFYIQLDTNDDASPDRISLVKGELTLNSAKKYETLKVPIPIKNEVKKDGFTISPSAVTERGIEFEIKFYRKAKLPPEVMGGGCSVVIRFEDHSEKKLSNNSSSYRSAYQLRTYTYYSSRNRTSAPAELKITYPTDVESETFPFEFRNIGLPDKTGMYHFKE